VAPAPWPSPLPGKLTKPNKLDQRKNTDNMAGREREN